MNEISDGSSKKEPDIVRPPIFGTDLETFDQTQLDEYVNRLYKDYQAMGSNKSHDEIYRDLADLRAEQGKVTRAITKIFEPDEPWNKQK